MFEGPCFERRSILQVLPGLGIHQEWECSAGVGELQLQASRSPGAGLGHGSATLLWVYLSFLWAGLQWGLPSKAGFLVKKKSLSEDTHHQVFICLTSDRTGHTRQPSWVCSSFCNKQDTEPSLSFALSFWQICMLCSAGQRGLAESRVFPPHGTRRQL